MKFLVDIVPQAITSRIRHLTPTMSIQVDVFVCAPNEDMRLAGYFSLSVTLAPTTCHGKGLLVLFLLMSRDSGDYYVVRHLI
jgi:hypothetical protein